MNTKHIFIFIFCAFSFLGLNAQTPNLFEVQILKDGKPFNLETDYLTPADSGSIIQISPIPSKFLKEKLTMGGIEWKLSGNVGVTYAVGKRPVSNRNVSVSNIQLNPNLLIRGVENAKQQGIKSEDLNSRIIVAISNLEGKMADGEKKVFKNEQWLIFKVKL